MNNGLSEVILCFAMALVIIISLHILGTFLIKSNGTPDEEGTIVDNSVEILAISNILWLAGASFIGYACFIMGKLKR